MAFKIKRKEISAVIPTASMADIAFLLIIFFMVTTKFHVDRTRVELPKSEQREELPRDAAFVVVYKTDEMVDYGFKYSDGENTSYEVDRPTLEIELNGIASVDTTRPVVVKADGDTPYEYIDQAVEMMRRAGLEEVILLTEQRTVADE